MHSTKKKDDAKLQNFFFIMLFILLKNFPLCHYHESIIRLAAPRGGQPDKS